MSQVAVLPDERTREKRERSTPGKRETLRAKAITRQTVSLVNIAWVTVFAAIALSGIGMIVIATTEASLALKQAAFLAVAVLCGTAVAVPHYDWARRLSYPLLGLVLLLLIFVLVPGVPESIVRPRNGARRWISTGIADVQFQPSELAKIAFVLALSAYLRFKSNHRTLKGLLIPFILMFIPMGLILVEPDLGTSLLFVPTLFAMLIAAGAKIKHIAMIVILGLALAPMAYPFLQPHQKDRIQAMVNQVTGDTSRTDSIGYQGDRAMTLVGAGGLTGVGATHARDLVVHNGLPEEHNDMIFAVVVTRWGLIGGVAVLACYLVFALGGLLTAGLSKDAFGRLVVVGCLTMILTQMTINIGMTIGLLPITGMTLPFVSYGGSSLVANWLMVGLIFNVALRRPRMMTREPFAFGETDSR